VRAECLRFGYRKHLCSSFDEHVLRQAACQVLGALDELIRPSRLALV